MTADIPTAAQLDETDPLWFYRDLDAMSPGLASEARRRRDAAVAAVEAGETIHDPDREGQ